MDDSRRCRAHARTGDRCGKAALLGGFVCRNHGGAAGHVRRAAARRLEELQPPAIDAYERALAAEVRQLDRRGEIRILGPDHPAQIRAATTVLDRTGMGPSSTSNVNLQAGERLAALIAVLDGPTDDIVQDRE